MPKSNSCVILWIRRDLRLNDNLALAAAIDSGRPVIPLYIREEPLAGALGAAQAWWLHHSLAALDAALLNKGSRLVLRSGRAEDVLDRLISEMEAGAVYWNRRYDPDAIASDSSLKASLQGKGIDARSFAGFLLHEPTRVLTGQGKPYRVYTPFWRAVEAGLTPLDPLEAPDAVPSPSDLPHGEPLEAWNLLPSRPDWAAGFATNWTPGEDGALARLDDFVSEGLAGYAQKRDFPATPATSRLSPHLAMGEISPHRIWRAAGEGSADAAPDDMVRFRKELVWREFGWNLLFNNPAMPQKGLDARFDAFGWTDDPVGLAAWKRGRTGYPIVDAGMRELWQTGIMHNRIRMVVGSFLIKDLLIDWREGERWFRDTLLDADPASNAMNWQWVAGCGADASPWFRIFNPVKQGETFDPEGHYVRRWCPELARLPDKYLHRPFEAPREILRRARVALGVDYPEPIVQHDQARLRALAALKALPSATTAA
jgi:deoxyribodipyrimidine photo-lyase